MASPIEATLILCDAAVADPLGKLHMLGAGWSITTSPTGPSAVAALVKVPWDRANTKLSTSLVLVDADGAPVSVSENQRIGTETIIEVGRPPGLKPGTPLDAALALTVGPLPLPPGRYQWRLTVAEQEFSVSFEVRAPDAASS
jgi:hypothetical protein